MGKDDYVPNELGWQPDHISMFGASPNGTPKKWEMLYLYGHKIGGCVPFYIDWGQCDHPSASIPEVGSLKSLIIRAPAGHKVHDLLSAVSGIEVEEGDTGAAGANSDDAGNFKLPTKPELLPLSG